ncbi:hypothetical protein EV426DRAFT_534536 [Tirmania nivea]|nr:hypothetical protein EV426DRAFT_534536 [Tirmania nivea]
MAHNNDSTAASFGRELPGAEHEHPTYGILTRTLIHSPVVKQIIPARIRGKDFNDVVFVAETYIELYLLNDDGKLRRVATKSDFQADIRHAKVFATGTGSVGDAGVLSDDVMAEDTKGLLPPHILALTLDSGHLGFLYAVTKGDEVEFVMSTRRIDTKGVHPKNLGKSLAVDPK